MRLRASLQEQRHEPLTGCGKLTVVGLSMVTIGSNQRGVVGNVVVGTLVLLVTVTNVGSFTTTYPARVAGELSALQHELAAGSPPGAGRSQGESS